jgi:hypothetical protein
MEIINIIVSVSLYVAIIVGVSLLADKFMQKHERKRDSVSFAANTKPLDTNEELISEKQKIMEDKKMDEKCTEQQKGTRDLFLETLTKLGCQYEIDNEEDGDIHFGYQGEYFTVRASNDCRYVQIFDTHWGHVELYDVDELSRLKKAINESNLRNSVTTVYTVDEAGSNVDVHCKSVILFVQEIPDIENYLRLELSEYFQVHQFIGAEMARQREAEAKNA